MALFCEFFSFELKFRLKSLSTYVYLLSGSSSAFFRRRRGLHHWQRQGAAQRAVRHHHSLFLLQLFGPIVIAAIFGTSMLRDFQRDTFQLIFTKPITKFAYLGGRWAGSFVACVFAFSGMVFGEVAGTYAPWADHTRIASATCGGTGAVLFHRRHPDLLPGLALLSGRRTLPQALHRLSAGHCRPHDLSRCLGDLPRHALLEHFWSGIFDPSGCS